MSSSIPITDDISQSSDTGGWNKRRSNIGNEKANFEDFFNIDSKSPKKKFKEKAVDVKKKRNMRRSKIGNRKAKFEDFIQIESKYSKNKFEEKKVDVKKKLFNFKVPAEVVRDKRVKNRFIKEGKYKVKKEDNEIICFNTFSVLENEELNEELKSHHPCEIFKITQKELKKKKKKKLKKVQTKSNIGSVQLESSEGKYPKYIRCIKCFKTHFPSTKACKFMLQKKDKDNELAKIETDLTIIDEETTLLLKYYICYLEAKSPDEEILRLRGGARNGESNSPMLVTRAVESARKHGIDLVQGILNDADGNCAFDAVINNINHRNCFSEKLSLSSIVYRQIWVTELEKESSKYPTLGAGYTREEKEENWNRLKQSGVYEIDFFGDMVMHAIARGCNKNILIFNTDVEAADPIYVVEANQFGGFTDSDIPVVVAYNQVHYESLHPITNHDIEKTKMLVNSYTAGTYQYKKKDIPFLIADSSERKSETVFVKSQYDVMFPSLSSKPSKVVSPRNFNTRSNNKKPEIPTFIKSQQETSSILNTESDKDQRKIHTENQKSKSKKRNVSDQLGTQKVLNVRKLTEQERKLYRRKQYKKISNLKEVEKRQRRKLWASEKTNQRMKKRQENNDLFKKSMAVDKKSVRAKKREENNDLYKKSMAVDKKSMREKKREENPSLFKENMRNEQTKSRINRTNTEEKRGIQFKKSIKNGRIYECVSCHRVGFQNGVLAFTNDFELKIQKDFPGIVNSSIGIKQTSKIEGMHYICFTCKNHISRGKVPPMSNQNNLQLIDLSNYEELHLTELENSMIALNIIFQKVFKLPKSRWPAMKDKTVNIPIFESDVLKTIESLPRTPSEAGIIPINFKRKLEYKNSHMIQYISVPKMIKALNTLKEMGNRYYQFIPTKVNFEDECRENDLEGFQFIYPEDEIAVEELSVNEKSIT